MGGVLADHHELVGGAIAAEGGFIDGTEGDAFFATFQDALSAARAAVAALRALRSHEWPDGVGELRVRMGMHVGYAIAMRPGMWVSRFTVRRGWPLRLMADSCC